VCKLEPSLRASEYNTGKTTSALALDVLEAGVIIVM